METGREPESREDGVPLPVTNSCVGPLAQALPKPGWQAATITPSTTRTYFFTCYEPTDKSNEKDAVVCDLQRKHH